jgi:hypothetical protein
MVFVWKALSRCNKVVYQDVSKYHYIQFPGSAFNRFKDSFWSVQKACRILVDYMNDHYPDSIVWAEKTALLGNMLLAKRLFESGNLSLKNYNSLKKEISVYYSKKSAALLPRDYAIGLRLFRFNRYAYGSYIKLLLFRSKLKAMLLRKHNI